MLWVGLLNQFGVVQARVQISAFLVLVHQLVQRLGINGHSLAGDLVHIGVQLANGQAALVCLAVGLSKHGVHLRGNRLGRQQGLEQFYDFLPFVRAILHAANQGAQEHRVRIGQQTGGGLRLIDHINIGVKATPGLRCLARLGV